MHPLSPKKQPTNQPTKELNEGTGTCVKEHDDVLRSVWSFLQFTTSLGSGTDASNYNWDCAKANEFPVTVEDLEVDNVRTIFQEAVALYIGGINLAGRLSGIRTQNGHVSG
jgi:hypothetical protein